MIFLNKSISNSYRALDESPRWLIQMGKSGEAIKVLNKAARYNREKFTPAGSMEEIVHQMSQV